MEKLHRGEPDGDGNKVGSSRCVDPVPQSLKEVAELMSSVNRRLEDCAVEWQATLSRKQWRILHAQSTTQTSWEHSLLARTYLTDKILDEEFEKLRICGKKLLADLNNFVGLLRGENANVSGVKNTENQLSGSPSTRNPPVTPLDLSLLEENKPPEEKAERRRSKRLAENTATTVQQSFADLIKAKIDLDTKFLGFEAVLNGTGGITPSPPSEGAKCLCQICSSVLGSVIHNDYILREAVTKPKVRRMTRAKSKRLTKSPKIWKRNSARVANQSNK
ncbi:uncharacterized protein LOC107038254 [Diachasma alloeum]|uniref:uncharacterized protein LOC107038254 n=1 Tax=Diachasma alloeum TaxID=454923 RepID=UPI0007382EF1|nr:uncharacterized protein LOC107038254 [Diachasma alloeum]